MSKFKLHPKTISSQVKKSYFINVTKKGLSERGQHLSRLDVQILLFSATRISRWHNPNTLQRWTLRDEVV